MQTSPIQTTASVTPNANAAGRQNDGGSVDTPFNQVLSREVAGRRDAEQAKTSESKNANDGSAAKSPTTEASAPAEAKPSDKARTDKEDDTAQETATNAATPDEMLALVANLGMMGVVRTDAHAEAHPDARTTEAAAGMAPAATGSALAVATGGAKASPADALPALDGATKTEATPKDAASAAEPRFGKALGDAAARHRAEPAEVKGRDATAVTASTAAASTQAAKPEAATALQAATPAAADLAARAQDALATAPIAAHAALQPLQHAAISAAHGIAAQPGDRLTPPVGTAAWDQALGQKVVWMVAGEQQSASLTLNPPDLGPLQVVLNVSNSQANATFVAAQPEVRQALEAAMPRLREMLGDAGIQLGQASVSAGMPNHQNAPGEREAQASSRRAEPADGQGDAAVRVSRVSVPSGRQGMVDTFA